MGAKTSQDVLRRLEALHPKVIDLSLERVKRLLGLLGRPEDQLPCVVHVAGTNGKGSVVAFLRAIFEAHGLRCHVFTSPHLIRFHERIVVAGKEIAEGPLMDVLEECERVNAGAPITFFEITTAAALLAFSRTPADVTLLETGLGGRLDATNVVARPRLTVITPIALDHQGFLGDTLEAIATEKAGILKPGTPCISARQPAEAASVIRRRAEALSVSVAWEGEHWQARGDPDEGPATGGGMVYESPGATWRPPAQTGTWRLPAQNELWRLPAQNELWRLPAQNELWRLPAPGLAGQFQIGNAGLAIAGASSVLGTSLKRNAVASGVRDARWPGRLQRLDDGPLRALLPASWELWLDGAHNPAAAAVLAAEARQNWSDRPNAFIVGMLRTKDASRFLAAIAGSADDIVAVTIPRAAASLTAEELSDIGRSAGLGMKAAASVEDGLRHLAASMSCRGERPGSRPARVIICGSLYLAGWVLMRNAARSVERL